MVEELSRRSEDRGRRPDAGEQNTEGGGELNDETNSRDINLC